MRCTRQGAVLVVANIQQQNSKEHQMAGSSHHLNVPTMPQCNAISGAFWETKIAAECQVECWAGEKIWARRDPHSCTRRPGANAQSVVGAV